MGVLCILIYILISVLILYRQDKYEENIWIQIKIHANSLSMPLSLCKKINNPSYIRYVINPISAYQIKHLSISLKYSYKVNIYGDFKMTCIDIMHNNYDTYKFKDMITKVNTLPMINGFKRYIHISLKNNIWIQDNLLTIIDSINHIYSRYVMESEVVSCCSMKLTCVTTYISKTKIKAYIYDMISKRSNLIFSYASDFSMYVSKGNSMKIVYLLLDHEYLDQYTMSVINKVGIYATFIKNTDPPIWFKGYTLRMMWPFLYHIKKEYYHEYLQLPQYRKEDIYVDITKVHINHNEPI